MLSSLVSYDGSGSEGEDEPMTEPAAQTATVVRGNMSNSNQKSTTVIKSKSVIVPSKFIDDEDPSIEDEDEEGNGNVVKESPVWSKFLPQPKKVAQVAEVEDDFEVGPIPPKKTYGDEELPPPKSLIPSLTAKKVQGKVRISIPFLDSLTEEEPGSDLEKKKLMYPSEKGSGLFAILPQPKNAFRVNTTSVFSKGSAVKSHVLERGPSGSSSGSESLHNSTHAKPSSTNRLIPDSVKNKLKRSAAERVEEVRAKYSKKAVSGGVSSAKIAKRDSDGSDDDDTGDFFSLDSTEEVDPAALERLKLPMPQLQSRLHVPDTNESSEQMDTEEYQQQPSSTQSEDLMKFIQPKKGRKEQINIIDISADDLRPDNTEWIKNITDESAVPARRGKGLGGMVKRKHQITYLAFEAKAREQELKNQWAQNRANKMATKNKYGF